MRTELCKEFLIGDNRIKEQNDDKKIMKHNIEKNLKGMGVRMWKTIKSDQKNGWSVKLNRIACFFQQFSWSLAYVSSSQIYC